MMEAASTLSTSVKFYQTTKHNIPEDTSSYSTLRKPEISKDRV
jgi:hypothetical protein